MRKLIDLTGKKFGRLTVIEMVGTHIYPCGTKIPLWKCKCDCGNERVIHSSNLRKGQISCGCFKKENPNRLKHGLKGTRIYDIWQSMKQRCCNSKSINYKDYGARGITICDEWLHDFQAFYNWSMLHGYKDNLEIDRIDNDKGYIPENCCWTTREQQQNNKRNNHFIEYNGKKQTVSQWSKELNIDYDKLLDRVNKLHWSIEKALTP